jgi:hypothetical protein
MPVPGEVDIVIASELMGAGRAIERGRATRVERNGGAARSGAAGDQRVAESADILPAAIARWLLKTPWARRLVERCSWPHRAAGGRNRCASKTSGPELRDDYALAMKAAGLPGLLKGYGDTHPQGRREFDAAMSALAGRGHPVLPRDVQ